MFSDHIQVIKTGNEKELVLAYLNDIYFVVTLFKLAEFGGIDTVSLKKGLDSVFEGSVPLFDYQTKLMSATSNGANMNLGIYSGALTMMKETRPYLITIHCANPRLKLALKNGNSKIRRVGKVLHKYFLPLQEFWQP